MSEWASRTDGNLETHYVRYSRSEIREAWGLEGRGHREAMAGGPWCVAVPFLSPREAEELAALFVRRICAMPTCTYFDGIVLSLYCGAAGRESAACLAHTVALVDRYTEDRDTLLAETPDLFAED